MKKFFKYLDHAIMYFIYIIIGVKILNWAFEGTTWFTLGIMVAISLFMAIGETDNKPEGPEFDSESDNS